MYDYLTKSLHKLINIKHIDQYHKVYDQCLWDILVADEKELIDAFNVDWDLSLPSPIHTALCQRLALITSDEKLKKKAIGIAMFYCDSIEEKNVAIGVTFRR